MEEPAPIPVKAPSRPIPKATERPLRNADYISLLKKPVVEGRKNIEAEVTAKNAETPPVRSPEIGFTDWNTPNFEKAEVKSPETSSAPLPKPKASEPEKPEITPESKASDSDEIFKKPANISETDFSLEDILEEFRDK
ncbi:MAG: hypothetical protein EOM14_14335 [Clostridia bacterium]|nr:hypothetical protein [Clostridia bacterium]